MTRIEVVNQKYFDIYGNETTKEASMAELKKIDQEVDELYNQKVDEIVAKINSEHSIGSEKLRALFDYFTSSEMKYDLQGRSFDGRLASDEGYPFKKYGSYRISQGTKYPAVLYGKGICSTYSLAFLDIAERLGIPCRLVNGYTGMEHVWNAVYIQGELKHIDVAFALMLKDRKEHFFLKDLDEIIYYGGSRQVESSLEEIERSIKNQFDNFGQERKKVKIVAYHEHPQNRGVKIVGYHDNQPKREVKINAIYNNTKK